MDFYIHGASFLALLSVIALYLWFVLKAGPKLMEKRDPIKATLFLRLYNIYQVLSCSCFLIGSYRLGFTFKYFLQCETFSFLSEADKLLIKIGFWLFLLLRLSEFSETLLFVLRKKHKQASFLHIFHHIGSVLVTWLFLVMGAGKLLIFCSKLW
jgi:elongation of very long chain fatty acids protein 1